jgi:hypothetical protein
MSILIPSSDNYRQLTAAIKGASGTNAGLKITRVEPNADTAAGAARGEASKAEMEKRMAEAKKTAVVENHNAILPNITTFRKKTQQS